MMPLFRHTQRGTKTKSRYDRRRARPQLEGLEGRKLLTGAPSTVTPTASLIQKASDTSSAADQVYLGLQQVAGQLAIAAEHGTIPVGTFDRTSGKFTGLGGIPVENDDPPDWDPTRGGPLKPIKKPPSKPVPGVAYLNAVNAGLTFSVTGDPGDFSVTANGTTVSAAPGQYTVAVEVGTATNVAWTVRAGVRSYSSTLQIHRPPHIGVATIPIVPLAVVYDVPQDNAGQNVTTVTQTSGRSTTVSMTVSTENSTSTPADVPGGYSDLMAVRKVLSSAGPVLSAIPGVGGTFGQVLAAAGRGFSLISGFLGSADAVRTNVTTDARVTSHGVSYTDTGTSTPNTHLGPGDGDVIRFIRDVRLVTASFDGQAATAKLSDKGIQSISVHLLKAKLKSLGSSDAPDPETGLDRKTIQALLALDPLAAGGPDAPLDPARFQSMGVYGVNGTRDTYEFSCTLTSQQANASTQTTVNAENYTPGALSFLGLGVTDNKSTKVTVTNTATATDGASQTRAVRVTLNAGANEYYNVEAFYDSVFGTVLYRKVTLSPDAQIVGRVKDGAGTLQANVLVTLTQDGRIFATRTDAHGGYVFQGAPLRSVASQIRVGSRVRPLDLSHFNPQGGKATHLDLQTG
jgi:hypothetical protein